MKRSPSVRDYMTPSPHWIGAGDALSEARLLMREHGIRHLPVFRATRLVGVLSDVDLSLVQSLPALRPEAIAVEEAMTPAPYAVPSSTSIREVARTMAQRKVGSAVVEEDGVVVGVFTTTDALRALVDVLEDRPRTNHTRPILPRRRSRRA